MKITIIINLKPQFYEKNTYHFGSDSYRVDFL